MFTPVSHQIKAKADIINNLQTSVSRMSICVISGAGGKSIVIASIGEYTAQYEGYRVLIVTHRKELLLQNIAKVQHGSVGLVSSSLKRWEYDKDIVVAGINTIFNKADKLGKIHLIIIDECQRLSNNPDDNSMYWQLINAYPMAKVVGFTALPHRLADGALTWGTVCHFTSYEDLLLEGYVTRLSNKVCLDPNLKLVEKRGGDYVQADFSTKCLNADILRTTTKKAFQVFLQKGLKKGIGFAPTVKDAHNIGYLLHEAGFKIWGKDGLTGVLTGENTPAERDEILRRHKVGEFDFIMNIEILTEGYDDPELDLLCNWRPTQSLSLWHQMLYRVVRLVDKAIWGIESKDDRLEAIRTSTKPLSYVLDFAGNLKAHGGLVDTSWKLLDGQIINLPQKKKNKVCVKCEELIPALSKTCPECGYVFLIEEREANINEHFDEETDIDAKLSPIKTYTVSDVKYFPDWKSSKGHAMLKVYYFCGKHKIPDYIWNNRRAAWLKQRGWTSGAVNWESLKKPKTITINTEKQFGNIVKYGW